MTSLRSEVTAVVLAGGMGRRMDGVDKGLVQVAGREMIGYVIDALAQNVEHVVVNANRNLEHYERYAVAVVPDSIEGYQGPLAGIEAGLSAANTPWVYTCPCDSPMQSADLLPHMWSEVLAAQADIGVAHDGERTHPVFLLLRRELLTSLRAYLDDGQRKIDRWFESHRLATIDCSQFAQSFVNVNTEEQLADTEQFLASS
ncbi:MAG: molybdenum cofactor guanylyltransferase MobA [Pseudomonadota bacterium]